MTWKTIKTCKMSISIEVKEKTNKKNTLPNMFLDIQLGMLKNILFFETLLCSKMYYRLIVFFLLDFGLSWLTSLQFIHYYVAGFYKPTIPQSPPSHQRDYSTCNNFRKCNEKNCYLDFNFETLKLKSIFISIEVLLKLYNL